MAIVNYPVRGGANERIDYRTTATAPASLCGATKATCYGFATRAYSLAHLCR
jgi:hypothetical protein